MKSLILGSSSPRREEILRKAGFSFNVLSVDVDESEDETLGLEGLCMHNARLKAETVYNTVAQEEALIIGSDTVVWLEGRAYGKPESRSHAYQMLRELSGKTHQVGTGVCLISEERTEAYCEVSEVTFHSLSEADITSYVEDVYVMDKAGSYAIQDEGKRIIKEFKGEYECIMGLPIKKLTEKLIEMGIKKRYET